MGIGTTVPGAPLHVYNTAASKFERTGASSTGVLNSIYAIRQNSAGAGANNIGTGINFLVETETEGTVESVGYIAGRASDATAGTVDGELSFVTTKDNVQAEVMTIDADGNVGIGTINPGEKLHVYGKTLIGDSTDISPDGSGSGILRINGNGYTGFLTMDASSMSLGHNSGARRLDLMTDETTRLSILGTGNVGVGTSLPTEKLEVNGNIKASGRVVASVSTDADALTAITADFTNTNMVRATGAAAACGTLDFTNVAAGGSFTVTIPNATATCTTIQLNGSGTGVKLPSGYSGGDAVSGVVYTAIYDGTTLWVSYVPF